MPQLLNGMREVLASHHGLGLAAPQVRASVSCFLMRELGGDGASAIINPRVVSRSGQPEFDWEGCLSVPGLVGTVKRASRIAVQYVIAVGIGSVDYISADWK